MLHGGTGEHALERAPVVRGGMPVLGHALEFGKGPLEFLKRCQARYGDIFTVRFPGTRRTFLMNPLDYPAYFKHRDLAFEEFGVEVGSRVFGYSLEHAEQALSERIHWQFNTFMRGDPLHAMSERMQAKLEERLFALPPGQWVEGGLFEWANEHVFAAGTEAIFGDGTYGEEIKRAYTTVDKHFPLLAMGVPAWLIPGCASAQRTLGNRVQELGPRSAQLMKERRAWFDERGLSDQVRGHLDAAVMWAAQANTVSAAFWTLLFVLRDPRARAELLDEVRRLAGGSRPSSPGERLHFFMLPFGGGKSMCPGRYFAINEFKITTATLLAWFDLELLSDEVPSFDLSRTGFGTYPPCSDVPFRVRLRAN